MKVQDIYERTLYTIGKEESLLEAVEKMEKFAVEGLVVVDEEGKAIGYITQGDILRAVLLTYEELVEEEGLLVEEGEKRAAFALHKSVKEAMSSPPLVVREETPLMRVISLMAIKRVECLPVVDKEGKLVGIVNRRAVLKALREVR
ncbi:MAG: HPP family protein [bacterium]